MFVRLFLSLVLLLTIANGARPENAFFLTHEKHCKESRSMQQVITEALERKHASYQRQEPELSATDLTSRSSHLLQNKEKFTKDQTFGASLDSDSKLDSHLSNRRLEASHHNDRTLVQRNLAQNAFLEDWATSSPITHNHATHPSRSRKLASNDDMVVPLNELSPDARRDVVITGFNRLVQLKNGWKDIRTKKRQSISTDYLPHLGIDILDGSRLRDTQLLKDLSLEVPCVLFPVEANFERHISATPNDEYYAQQWHLHKDDYGANVAGAWECSQGGSNGTLVAHVDTGCALHPDLEPNLCKCNQACASYDATAGDNPFIDKNGHGTMVAGVFAAKSNNGYRHAGISGESEVMCIKVDDNQVDDNQGKIYFSAIVKAAEYILERNVKIVNFSLTGFGRSTTEAHVFQRLVNEGVLVITAAGNFGDSKMKLGCNIDAVDNVNGCQDIDSNQLDGPFPAAYGLKNVIVVGASDKEGKAWAGSNYGSKSVDLFAPGVEVHLLHPSSTLDVAPFVKRNGTSFSAAMVTGMVLELLRHDPTLTPLEARDFIIQNTRTVEHLTGLCRSGGILDAHAAMVALSKRKPCTNGSFNNSPTPTAEQIRAYEQSQCFTRATPRNPIPRYNCKVHARTSCSPEGIVSGSNSRSAFVGAAVGVTALLGGSLLYLSKRSKNGDSDSSWDLGDRSLDEGEEGKLVLMDAEPKTRVQVVLVD